jgi:hypothetical protein
LADIANLQVEEGYSFAFMALAVAIMFFVDKEQFQRRPLLWGSLVVAMCALVYLSKSSMILVSLVLALAAALRLKTVGSRVLIVLLFSVAPLGWATYQYVAGGRFTFGTSLDGANLHKGNNETFLTHYPPAPPHNLDEYDSDLVNGHVFKDEWDYSDWHKRAAIDFIKTHPKQTILGVARKAWVVFFSLTSYGSGVNSLSPAVVWLSLLLVRLLFWSAVLFSLYALIARTGQSRDVALLFLALVLAFAFPYLAGFGYVRHASVIIFPSALTICRLVDVNFWGDAGTTSLS